MTETARTWNVKAFGAKGDGSHDDTTAFQNTLGACAEVGGGVVNVPPGEYIIGGTLTLDEKVTLRGTAGAVDGWGMPTVLRAFDTEREFIRLKRGAGVQFLEIFYPEQVLKAGEVRPYPYTILATGEDCSVISTSLRNSYNGINLTRAARHLIRDVHGSPLNIGLFVDQCYDVGRIENVHYWPFMGPTYEDFYLNYLPTVATAFMFGRSDWEYVSNTFCWGYKIGYHFSETEHGSCNGNFSGIGADKTQDATGGLLISNGEFVPINQDDSTAFVVNETNNGHVSFSNCAVWGPSHQIARIAGTGTVNFTSCNFIQNDKNKVDAPAIECSGGNLSVSSSHFRRSMNEAMTAPQVAVREGAKSAVVFGNMCDGEWRAVNEIGDRAQFGMNVGTA